MITAIQAREMAEMPDPVEIYNIDIAIKEIYAEIEIQARDHKFEVHIHKGFEDKEATFFKSKIIEHLELNGFKVQIKCANTYLQLFI